MCFLYRQSISIVYESKFKYIYRYFIKIDRCFCGILQSLPLRKCGLKWVLHGPLKINQKSLPLRKCGLKLSAIGAVSTGVLVTSLAEVWIEIWDLQMLLSNFRSLPLRKCGLKLPGDAGILRTGYVTSLAEVWIEIYDTGSNFGSGFVTSLAEVWIEIINTAYTTV